MKKLLVLASIIYSSVAFAQTNPDTVKKLNEVTIKPYFSVQPILRATGSIGLINNSTIAQQPANSLVASANTVSGVRMEERSPGSYRLSVRGSLLRSPFGVRNVKIYFADYPLTDAGGNSYLNAIDISAIAQLQILKGPQGSIYGANTAGVILIDPAGTSSDSSTIKVNLEGGSFGAFRENISLNKEVGNYAVNITQAYQTNDGYRNHSAMQRKYIQALQKWNYNPNASLKSLIFYSDLNYQTPGGLTAAQFADNPKLSRPAAGPNKSAIEQQAGIHSKTLFGGVTHDWNINQNLKHLASVFSSYTDFKNPFISNFELRRELTIGLRSYLEYHKSTDIADWNLNLGLESMKTGTDFDNFDNNLGVSGAIQAAHDLNAFSNFGFANISASIEDKLMIELSSSLNFSGYDYKSIAPITTDKQRNNFKAQLMPRLALSYLLDPRFSIRASASKGYSTPTIQEIRPSNNIINVDLQPELGWDYEAGLRYEAFNSQLTVDVNGFFYNLKNAIVRRINDNATEFFVNSGGTKQFGLESSVSLWILSQNNSAFIRGLKINNAFTLSRFRFDDYIDRTDDFSGNSLTGVPEATMVSGAELSLPSSIYIFVQHNYTSSIPLNDANTVYARKYHLLQAKAGIKSFKIGNVPVEVYVGADNLLNEKYSLGNDINAFGNRFFNPAATRNFYCGLTVKI
ncbi:MAG: TonB-dependent receptor [Pedobacter sp.]|nr:MAG: TonB-dependent receptor [Pedobacter sp.]